MILTANRKTFFVENIFRDVGAKIASDFVEDPSSNSQTPKSRPVLIAVPDNNATAGRLKIEPWALGFGPSLVVTL
jgi:hypothetical protein